MRIIGGKLKGKKIFHINNLTTRPLRDFVRENVFNIIDHSKLIDIKIKNSSVLDLYSGIGSFGLECISREANNVTFVEKDKNALMYLNKNIEELLIKKKISIFTQDTSQFFKINKINKYDIVFLDPPYAKRDYTEDLKFLKKLNLMNKKHLIIIHREKKSNETLEELINIKLIKHYGRSKIIFGCFY